MAEEYFTESQAADQGGQSAIARLEASAQGEVAVAPDSPHYSPDEPQQNGGETPGAQAPQQPIEQAQAAEPEWSYDLDRQGQKHKLSREQVNYILNFGLDAFQRAQQGQQQQPPAPAQQQQQSQAQDQAQALVSRIERLESQLEEARTQKQIDEIQGKIDTAVGKLKIYGELKDPKHQSMVRDLTMLNQYRDRNLSPESAAQQVEELVSSLLRDRASAYVQSKVQQAGNKVEAGGSPAASTQKPLGAKDIANGNVLRSAVNRLKSIMAS